MSSLRGAVLMVSTFFFAGPSCSVAQSPTAPPLAEAPLAEMSVASVERLRQLYTEDATFRADVDAAFESLHPLPGGAPNPWTGKSIEDLCDFFEAWHRFVPRPKEGLSYITEFLWFYFENPPALRLVRDEPGRSWTRDFVSEKAEFMDSAASLEGIDAWLEDPRLEIGDFVMPPGGFASFNDFFTRRLGPGARPVSAPGDDGVVVSPADCSIRLDGRPLTPETRIPIKGPFELEVASLLQDSGLVERFYGGTTLFCVLQPTSYHHFHAPVSGRVVGAREHVPGIYMGIAAMDSAPDAPGVHHGYVLFETESFGHVGMVTVGLQTISSIQYREDLRHIDAESEPVEMEKGERIGNFAYGGSLVMLFFEAGRLPELAVRQGQRLGTLSPGE